MLATDYFVWTIGCEFYIRSRYTVLRFTIVRILGGKNVQMEESCEQGRSGENYVFFHGSKLRLAFLIWAGNCSMVQSLLGRQLLTSLVKGSRRIAYPPEKAKSLGPDKFYKGESSFLLRLSD